ncbi:DNA recombination protein RmuC, partial [Nitratifractor sp.]
EENSRRFGDLSSDRVEEVLKPLRTQMTEFRDRIDRVHTEETRQRATLMQEVRQLRELNRRIGEEAESLSKALKGESKTRGIWGEMVLEKVLEASGLREGEEYVRERTMRNVEYRRLRPDVIVYLPDRRELIVDAKTSLVAYERYANAEDEEQKRRYAKEHLAAVKRHIDELAQKDYSRVEGIETLDFVMMFLPIEGALALALQEDPGLYDEAFSRHVVLVSPTALLVALRAVENSWRRERQNRNARKIARQAGALYDKFVAFAEDMERIGRQLETVRKSYDASWNKLSSGRNNIVRQIEKLRELGAETSREIPASMADEALDDEENKP